MTARVGLWVKRIKCKDVGINILMDVNITWPVSNQNVNGLKMIVVITITSFLAIL